MKSPFVRGTSREARLSSRSHAPRWPEPAPFARDRIGGAEYTVRRIREESDWSALAPEWDGWLERTPGHTVFQTYDYLRLWWEHFGRGHELCLLVVERDGRAVGVAPLQLQSTKIYGLRFRELGFLGSRWEVDRPVFLFPENSGDCVRAVVRYLVGHPEEWDLCRLYEQDGDAEPVRVLEAAFREAGHFLARTEDSVCPYLDLDGTWPEFHDALSRNLRRNIRTAGRRLESLGDVACRSSWEWEDVEPGLETYRDLEGNSWKSGDAAGINRSPTYGRFCDDLAKTFARRKAFCLRTLTVGDRPAAATFGLLHGDTFYSLQIVHDREMSRCSPGTYLESLELAECFASGCRRYEFLGGFLNNKSRWTATARPTVQIHVFRPRPTLRLLHAIYFLVKPRVKAGVQLLRGPKRRGEESADGTG